MKKLFILFSMTVLVLMGCSKPVSTTGEAAVSDGSEDLVIESLVSLNGQESMNFFNWTGNIRYIAAEDSYDATSGASLAGSTHLFQSYLFDVEGKNTMSSGLRGLFLYGVNGNAQVENDNLTAVKNEDGTIVIRYVHRGTAYQFTTDSKGILSLPEANIVKRAIGTPEEIEAEFSTDGTAQGVDYDNVFSSKIIADRAHSQAMYFFDGDLQVTLENGLLGVKGILTAVRQ